MPRYHKLGKIPHKRHTTFKKENGGYHYEELFGTIGFDGMSTLLYHIHRPTQVVDILNSYSVEPEIAVEKNMKAYLLDAFKAPQIPDLLKSRLSILINNDLNIMLSRALINFSYSNRNTDWLFDATWNYIGKSRIPMHELITTQYSDPFALINCQLTHKLNDFDVSFIS